MTKSAMTGRYLAPALLALTPLSAHAQDLSAAEGEDSVFSGDFMIVGIGPVLAPNYEGSDDLKMIPAGAVAGRVGGIGINARAAGVALDVIPSKPGQRIGFTLGPVVRYRSNRSGTVVDPVVAKLGKLPGIVEGGVVVGTDFKGVLNPHDSLSFGVDLRWSLSGKNGGSIISPGISYLTPISRAQVIGVAMTSNFVNQTYAQTNFGVTSAGSVASGLPVFTAKGGLKDIGLGLMTARDLNGNFLDGGFAIAAGGMYSRLFGSAAHSPLTTVRGRKGQWIFGTGLAYIF